MGTLAAEAFARAGLLGNPSDLYGGRGIGFAIAELKVEVTLIPAEVIGLPNELLRAGWRLCEREFAEGGHDARTRPFEVQLASTIPFQAGLSGSSAVLVAALRAWSAWFEVELAHGRIAELAWQAEAVELGSRAGPLDRLVQAHGGLLSMDFADPFVPAAIEQLDPALLPPLLIAWDPEPGAPSGDVHEPVWRRFEAGDATVRQALEGIAALASQGRGALVAEDTGKLRQLVNENFDLRARLFPIGERDRSMIDLGRGLGAATKFCGSGGSVLALPSHANELSALAGAYERAGFHTLIPTVAVHG